MPENCYDIYRLLPKYRKGECPDEAFVEEHLKTCARCTAELERLGGKLKIVVTVQEETNRAIRFVEAVKKHLWLQILLVVSAVVAFCIYCFVIGNAFLGSYIYMFDIRMTIFLMLEFIVCITAILILVTVLLRVSGAGARSKRRAVKMLAGNKMLFICVAVLVSTASLVGYGKIKDYINRNRFEPGVWSSGSRVFTNEWSNIQFEVPEDFVFADNQYYIDNRTVSVSQFEKQYPEACIDIWIHSNEPGCFIDFEILYINRKTYEMFAHIKDDEQLLKTAARLQFIKEIGTAPRLSEDEVEIAGETYYAVWQYYTDLDNYYCAFVRIYDDTVITISIRYAASCEDTATDFLRSIETVKVAGQTD